MRNSALMFTVSAAMFAAGCAHKETYAAARKTIEVKAAVTIARNDAGGFSFTYDAPFADEKGNFDFSQEGARFNTINLSFSIADGSVPGLTFKRPGEEAMWIVEKNNADPKTGSPSGPFRGDQFFGFEVSEDGKQLSLTNRNDDEILYRYALRFDLDGETVADDPDSQNGPK